MPEQPEPERLSYPERYWAALAASKAETAPPKMPRCGACHNGDHKRCTGGLPQRLSRGWLCACCGPR